MGIATPVIHRYLAQIQAKVGVKLLQTSPQGTVLTADGKRLAAEYAALVERTKTSDRIVIGGTILTEDLLLGVVSHLDSEAAYDVIISDDERNLRDFRAGLMDVIVLDDPLFAYEMADAKFEELMEDRLIHVDKGPNYLRFRYGAQRIGFRYLDGKGEKYSVSGGTRSLAALLRSNQSFFVNESLLLRKGIKLISSTDPSVFRHEILALYSEEKEPIAWLLRELKRTAGSSG